MESVLKVGAAKADITPERPCELSGFAARVQPSMGVHDPVWARALVFEGEGRRAALLACDLLGFEPEADARIRERLCREVGLEGVLLTCTHAHSCPASMNLHGCGSQDDAWMEELESTLLAVTRQAASDLAPVSARFTRTEARVGMNRRVPAGSGVERISARRDVPEGSESGVYDPDLTVLRFMDEKGQGKATLLNHACHPVSLGSEWRTVSCDFPGVAVRALERAHERAGFGLPLFVQGACGDINPDLERRGWAECERIGMEVAKAARAALGDSGSAGNAGQEISLSAPRYAERLVKLPYRNNAGEIEVTLSALAIGDAAFVTLPGEAFCTQGLEIRRRSPYPCTILAAYSNGNVGYLPTREAYPLGGYEVDSAHRYYGYPECVAPEAGELGVETALELLSELNSQTAQERGVTNETR
ncbi:MAG: neutral/alkaline non-lysosomal ceramidase N-terminal domain-containing protein [Armatimonadetes bacterium]|nr:neutral/alkaline non-lysosomal ceramidase N-terminal domain-containing protein [Armatimonadota bacterium]